MPPLRPLPLLLISAILLSCGGGSSSGTLTSIQGFAGAGAPILGTVTLRDADGTRRFDATDSNGYFEIATSGLTPPYLLWAEGVANGKSVTLYSMTTRFGTTNIHPITHLVTGLLAEATPSDTLASGLISDSAILAAEIEAKNVLDNTLTAFNMGTNFDLLQGPYAPNGEGIDQLFDLLDITVDGITITIHDRASDTDLFKQIGSATPVTDKSPTDITTTVASGKETLAVLDSVATALENLFGNAGAIRPNATTIHATLDPLIIQTGTVFMVNGRSDHDGDGQGNTDFAAYWADGSEEGSPRMGLDVESRAILRKMKSAAIGGATYGEIPTGMDDGVWAVLRIRDSHEVRDLPMAIVKKDNEWKWAGNQVPFSDGSRILAEAVWENPFDTNTETDFSTDTLTTGLGFHLDDGDEAFARADAIDLVHVSNPVLPLHTAGNYLTFFDDTTDGVTTWKIRNDALTGNNQDNDVDADSLHWGRRFIDGGTDAFVAADFSNPEFVCVALDGSTLKRVWIHLQPAVPPTQTYLDAVAAESASSTNTSQFNGLYAFFARILSINDRNRASITDLASLRGAGGLSDNSGSTTIKWLNAPLSYAETLRVHLDQEVSIENDAPVILRSNDNLAGARAWISETASYSGVGNISEAAFQIVTVNGSGVRYVTHRLAE